MYNTGLQHNTSGRSLSSTASEPSLTIDTFQSVMSEFTHVSPGKMAFYFFSNHLISYNEYKQFKKLSKNPDSDAEDINMDLLMKVYQVVVDDPSKIDAVYSALEKLKKDVAQKPIKDSEMCKFSGVEGELLTLVSACFADKKHSRSASACSSIVSEK